MNITPSSNPIPLLELNCDFTTGLEAATRGIHDAKQEICDTQQLSQLIEKHTGIKLNCINLSVVDRNAALASTIRHVANMQGWLAGWECLAEACPECGMHGRLMKDGKPFVKCH